MRSRVSPRQRARARRIRRRPPLMARCRRRRAGHQTRGRWRRRGRCGRFAQIRSCGRASSSWSSCQTACQTCAYCNFGPQTQTFPAEDVLSVYGAAQCSEHVYSSVPCTLSGSCFKGHCRTQLRTSQVECSTLVKHGFPAPTDVCCARRQFQEAQLAALIELKGLRLAALQRKVRKEVARHGEVLAEAKPDTLLEWRRWRRPAADPWGLGSAVAAAAAMPASTPAADQAAMVRSASQTCTDIFLYPGQRTPGACASLSRRLLLRWRGHWPAGNCQVSDFIFRRDRQ